MSVFIGSFIAVVIAALIQATNWMLLGNTIKPNLVLIVLIALSYLNPNWMKRLIFIFIAAIVIKQAPGFTFPDLVFFSTILLAIALADFLPWQQTINSLLAVTAGTLILNLQNITFLPFVYELILNLSLALILLALLKLVYVPQIKLQRNRF